MSHLRADLQAAEFMCYVQGKRWWPRFKRARVQEGPCIIFVDEIDALATKRAQAGQCSKHPLPCRSAYIWHRNLLRSSQQLL